MSYMVKAPLVVAKDQEGKDLYLYAGSVVPDSVQGEQVQRFVDEGFFVDSSADAKVEEPKVPAKATKPAASKSE